MKLFFINDRIEIRFRSLETLAVIIAKYTAMFFPLVESCLSEEILRDWQRNGNGPMNDKRKPPPRTSVDFRQLKLEITVI